MSSFVSKVSAALAAVCLLLAGLVGVAAPAQASEIVVEKNRTYKCDVTGNENVGCYADGPGSEGTNKYVVAECKNALAVSAPRLGRSLTGNFVDMNGNCSQPSVEFVPPPPPTAEECEADGKVLNEAGDACRDKTAEELCEESGKYWYDSSCNDKSPSEQQCLLEGDVWEDGECREWEEVVDIEAPAPGGAGSSLEGNDGQSYASVFSLDEYADAPTSEHVLFTLPDGVTQVWGIPVAADAIDGEPTQKAPPPPPCWSGEAGNNCPVGGALRFAAPEYAMVGVPITMYAYASWRPDANAPAQPTNGTAVIRVDGEDYSGVEFKDGVAEWRFIPETEGMKEFTASGVVFSNTSGASAYIDTVPARTYVLEYDPAAYADAFKNKLVEVGERYVITDIDQARSYLKGQYDWRVADKSEDVCAVYETKKGAVKAKFNEAGKCKVIWMDTSSGDKGNFTFIAEK